MFRVIRFVKSICGESRSEDGSSLVETALVSAVFFAMLLGCFQASLAFYASHYVDEVARETSRYLMVRGSTSCANTSGLSNCGITDQTKIQTYVQGLSYPGIQASKLGISVKWLAASATTPTSWTACGGACNAPGNQVQVVATYPFHFVLPIVPNTTFNISSTSTMLISQ
jgi:Flp pilus assembly protein TadG